MAPELVTRAGPPAPDISILAGLQPPYPRLPSPAAAPRVPSEVHKSAKRFPFLFQSFTQASLHVLLLQLMRTMALQETFVLQDQISAKFEEARQSRAHVFGVYRFWRYNPFFKSLSWKTSNVATSKDGHIEYPILVFPPCSYSPNSLRFEVAMDAVGEWRPLSRGGNGNRHI